MNEPKNTATGSVKAEPIKLVSLIETMLKDPETAKFCVTYDRTTAIIRCTARKRDRRMEDVIILADTLESVPKYDPLTMAAWRRDELITKLLARRLSQWDVAHALGISQSVVARVARARRAA
jgi:hypothetical protein